ncbi:hypothetical protein PSACC_01872 [Paramicrosporidium saccamoebae]|uniref:Uncharacterized protein n=1 Tax=Paramicrosporidium saccamoebae TaxID=1246581 RepID=A0A2H9TKR7_9FUNG|nr:hypothetical protein PSACC_01872 [Paramicrosporidium saccamoebae]
MDRPSGVRGHVLETDLANVRIMFDLLEKVLPYSLPHNATEQERATLQRVVKQHECLLGWVWTKDVRHIVTQEEEFAKRFVKLMTDNLLGYEERLFDPKKLGGETPVANKFLEARYQVLLNLLISAPFNSRLFWHFSQNSFLFTLGKLLHTPDSKETEMIRKLWLAILHKAANVTDQDVIQKTEATGETIQPRETRETGETVQPDGDLILTTQPTRDNVMPMVQEIISNSIAWIQAGFYDLKEANTKVSARPIGGLIAILTKDRLQQLYIRFAIPLIASPRYTAFGKHYAINFLRLSKRFLETPFHLEMFHKCLRCSFKSLHYLNTEVDIQRVHFILSIWTFQLVPLGQEVSMHQELLKHVQCTISERTRQAFFKALTSSMCVKAFSGTSMLHQNRATSDQVLSIILTELCNWLLKNSPFQLVEDSLYRALAFWFRHKVGQSLFRAYPKLLELAAEVGPLIAQYEEEQAVQMAVLLDGTEHVLADTLVLSLNPIEGPTTRRIPTPRPRSDEGDLALNEPSDPEEMEDSNILEMTSLDDFDI